jgi:maltooligosyltrehalose trehalohydrolase
MNIGAEVLSEGVCSFTVWAPLAGAVAVKLLDPRERVIKLGPGKCGYWTAKVSDVPPGTRYFFVLDGKKERPDPASHYQPGGVHGPSAVVDHNVFVWRDEEWRGTPLHDMVMYELHVGAFTPEGTLDAIIPRLVTLKDMGINTIELMPVSQFPGERNWGYDGTYPFAVQNSYGGPGSLKRLVNECHERGIAVILDVVYNHFGPEGNYLWDYGPYFISKYKTPWGDAINFDDAYSDEVRAFFVQNVLHWLDRYHVDALRLDAIHGITDMSARPFLRELAERTEDYSRKSGRAHYLMAESDLNDVRVITPLNEGGYGFHGQWCDDFHHSLHTLLTHENQGYYMDFGKLEHLAKSVRDGYVYSGDYSVFRKRRHGNSPKNCRPDQFVVFCQNHDQVGNRMAGERIASLVSFEALKLAAGSVILSPHVPLLFMGEEYDEEAPFLYFVSHSDHELIEAVRKGRKEEFRTFAEAAEPPDPQSRETFLLSKLQWERREAGKGKTLADFYRRLIDLRRSTPVLSCVEKEEIGVNVSDREGVLFVKRKRDTAVSVCIFNYSEVDTTIHVPFRGSLMKCLLDSADKAWEGPGSRVPKVVTEDDGITMRGHSFVVLMKEDSR